MRGRILVFVGAIALGLVGGYFLRAMIHAKPHVAGQIGSTSALGPQDGIGGAGLSQLVEVGFQSEAQEKADFSRSGGVTGWLHWAASLESAGLEDMLRLSAFTRGNTMARDMLFARWMELDPRHLFDTVTGEGRFSMPDQRWFESNLISEWSKVDLGGVVEALRTEPGRFDLQWPREQAAFKLLELDAEAGLELLREWRFVHMSEGLNSGALKQWVRADPRHAVDIIKGHPRGAMADFVFGLIGGEWAQSDPEAALTFASTELESDHHRWLMAGEALKAWAGNDLAAAADWLGEADAAAREKLAGAFVTAWAESDPAAALEWSLGGLRRNALTDAVVGVVTTLVERDLPAAAQVVSELAPSPARAAAARVVAWKWSFAGGSRSGVSQEAMTWMEGLDRTSLGLVLDHVARSWVRQDRDAVAEFLTGPETIGASRSTLRAVAENLVDHDPVVAIRWLGEIPGDPRARAAAWTVFSRWHRAEPEAAVAWLEEVPEDAGNRDTTVREVAQNIVATAQSR